MADSQQFFVTSHRATRKDPPPMPAPLTLSAFNARVRQAVLQALPDDCWIVAEISELRTAQNGHCYLELIEKDPKGQGLRARAAAHIWRNSWTLLRLHFEQETRQPLAPGLKVMVRARAEFHELYGYSLNLLDIDPTYTLGEQARRRNEILSQLQADGVVDLNKQLPLPRLTQRIAVVSSPSAAGYGDFTQQLSAAPFRFTLRLFPATMQGDSVEQSLIQALEAISHDADAYDCVVILRGGGSTSDLQGFESYLLAAAVAQFPLPILTGIGHERDDTVVDLVAHTRLKTPTAVAAFLIDHQQREFSLLQTLRQQVRTATADQLARHRRHFDHTARRIQLHVAHYSTNAREQIHHLRSRIRLAVAARLQRERQRLTLLEKTLQLADPRNLLRRGYSFTTHNGRILRSAADVRAGDPLETHLAQGIVHSRVVDIQTTP